MLTSGGYPEDYEKGKVITGLEDLDEDIVVFHSGTKMLDGSLVTNGGRVIGITTSAESVEEALACGAVRIGHGIHSIESPELLERLKAEKIYLELCYSSNLQTQAVKNSCEYPLIEFLKKGILVTINTDNMTVSNTSLKREYRLLKETFQLSEEMLLQLAENSVEAAFLPLKKKVKLEQKVKQEFLKWLSTERI